MLSVPASRLFVLALVAMVGWFFVFRVVAEAGAVLESKILLS
jgi:hypothetical protein